MDGRSINAGATMPKTNTFMPEVRTHELRRGTAVVTPQAAKASGSQPPALKADLAPSSRSAGLRHSYRAPPSILPLHLWIHR